MGKKDLLALIKPPVKPSKRETFGGKTTARVTDFFSQPDGSVFKMTRRINKDLSISDIIEHRHK